MRPAISKSTEHWSHLSTISQRLQSQSTFCKVSGVELGRKEVAICSTAQRNVPRWGVWTYSHAATSATSTRHACAVDSEWHSVLMCRWSTLCTASLPPRPPRPPPQGSSDIMVTEQDAAEQQKRIPGSVRINYDRWSHMDFTWLVRNV